MTVLPGHDRVEQSCATGSLQGDSSLTDTRRRVVQDALGRFCRLAGDQSVAHIVVGEVLCGPEDPGPVSAWLDLWDEDALRLALLFAAPPGQTFNWSDRCIQSASRWLARFRDGAEAYARERSAEYVDVTAPGLQFDMNTSVSAAGDYYRRGRIDRAICATLSMFTMACKRAEAHGKGQALMGGILDITLRLLMPVTPGMVESVWPLVSRERMAWPAHSSQPAETGPMLAVAVDGRVRGRFRASCGTSEITAYRMAEKLENVQRHLAGRRPHKVIYVPDRLINLVVT